MKMCAFWQREIVMKTLVFGAGNLLLTDEGFGVHCIRYLDEHFSFPEEVELLDAGTLGIMVTHKLEEAERIYIIDVIAVDGAAGEMHRYEKDDFMLGRIPLKLSPHQIGIQEVLHLSEMRGFCPEQVSLLGIIPESMEPGVELSPTLSHRLRDVCHLIIDELRASGTPVTVKTPPGFQSLLQGAA
jgi:hydrogenase maturation protease